METLFIATFLLWNSWLDIRKRKISLSSALLFSLGAILYCIFRGNIHLLSVFLGTLPGFVLMGISWLSGGVVGFGDGIAVFVLGLWVGLSSATATLFWGLVASSLFGLIQIIFKRANRKSQLPFLPFLTLGFFIHNVLLF